MRCDLAYKAPQGTKLMIISKERKGSLGAMPALACKLTQDFDIMLQVGRDVWSKLKIQWNRGLHRRIICYHLWPFWSRIGSIWSTKNCSTPVKGIVTCYIDNVDTLGKNPFSMCHDSWMDTKKFTWMSTSSQIMSTWPSNIVWCGWPLQEEEGLINSLYRACTKWMQLGCGVESTARRLVFDYHTNLVLFNILASTVLNVQQQLRRGKLMLAQAFVVVSLCNPTACHSNVYLYGQPYSGCPVRAWYMHFIRPSSSCKGRPRQTTPKQLVLVPCATHPPIYP